MSRAKEKIRAKWSTELIEPTLGENYTQSDLIGALNWYNNMIDNKTAVKYINSYLKTRKIDRIVTSRVSAQTAGAVARLIDRGEVNDKDAASINWMNNWVNNLDPTPPPEPAAAKPLISAQEIADKKLNLYISGLDDSLDDFIFNSDFKLKFNTEKYLADNNVKSSFIKEIINWAESVKSEFVESKTDKDLKEGYSNFSTQQKNKVIKFLDTMIDSIERYAISIKTIRVKKSKPASKLVSKVKYQKTFLELKLKSVTPETLIGAKEVWLYNSATKMLSYFTSQGGMTVSGTTIKGFDSSEQRRLRNPEDQLPILTKSRKGQWVKSFNQIAKTIVTSGKGRLNDSTIILKVF